MISAGIEGGSKRRIEEDWTLADVAAQRAYWREYGPPPNIALIGVAAGLGVDLLKAAAPSVGDMEMPTPKSGPSIAEISAAVGPIRGDPAQATHKALRKFRIPDDPMAPPL